MESLKKDQREIRDSRNEKGRGEKDQEEKGKGEWRRNGEGEGGGEKAAAQPVSDYISALQDLKQGLRKRKAPQSSNVTHILPFQNRN